MATIRLDIDASIDNRVLQAVSRYFGWPKGQSPPYQGMTRKEYVTKALSQWMTQIARDYEVKDSVDDAAVAATASAKAAAAALVVTGS